MIKQSPLGQRSTLVQPGNDSMNRFGNCFTKFDIVLRKKATRLIKKSLGGDNKREVTNLTSLQFQSLEWLKEKKLDHQYEWNEKRKFI